MELKATKFRYERPELAKPKTHVRLCRSDIMRAEVQVVREGGENNLHSHGGTDGFWMVLRGRVHFYGLGDEQIADLGPYEGIHIPRGFQYWFESASDEPLELLHISSVDVTSRAAARTDHGDRKANWKDDKAYIDASAS